MCVITPILGTLIMMSLRCVHYASSSNFRPGLWLSVLHHHQRPNRSHHHGYSAFLEERRERTRVYQKTWERFHKRTENYFTFISSGSNFSGEPYRYYEIIYRSCRHNLEGVEGCSGGQRAGKRNGKRQLDKSWKYQTPRSLPRRNPDDPIKPIGHP